jgi:hypothetical protein
MYRPRDLSPLGKHGASEQSSRRRPYGAGERPGIAGQQDTTYAQHIDDPTTESNPAHNPDGALIDAIHAEKIDRAGLLKNLDKLSNLELIRLSRSSYLSWSNRYNVRN